MAPTATWTAPRDWTAGETLSAANFDTYISSNLMWLKTPPTGVFELVSGNITTTSTTFVEATGFSIALTTTGGRVLMGFSGVAANSTAGQAVYFTFAVDGTAKGNASYGLGGLFSSSGGYRHSAGMTWLTPALSAASHTISVQWLVSANTGTLYANAYFWAMEV